MPDMYYHKKTSGKLLGGCNPKFFIRGLRMWLALMLRRCGSCQRKRWKIYSEFSSRNLGYDLVTKPAKSWLKNRYDREQDAEINAVYCRFSRIVWWNFTGPVPLVRMRSAVQICLAAPWKPRKTAVLRGFWFVWKDSRNGRWPTPWSRLPARSVRTWSAVLGFAKYPAHRSPHTPK